MVLNIKFFTIIKLYFLWCVLFYTQDLLYASVNSTLVHTESNVLSLGNSLPLQIINACTSKYNIYYNYYNNNNLDVILHKYQKNNIYSNFNELLYVSNYYKNYQKLKIQLQNDSVNLLHILHSSFNSVMYNTMLYYMQLGIQNFLSDKIITVGGGKRFIINDQYTIGYNVLLHVPSTNRTNYPYSINMGGEFWYNNFIFKTNSYYNIHRIFNYNKLSYKKLLEYPEIGYQVCVQTKLPYLSKCTNQIKLEKFFYNKTHKRYFYDFFNKYSLSIGIGYNPIPILNFNINSMFVNNKYENTTFTVTLNYRFYIPMMYQIKNYNFDNKHTHQKSVLFNDLDYISESFIPSNFDVIPIHSTKQSQQSISEIFGLPGEVKIIKIDNKNKSCIQWDITSFQKNGGDVVPLTDNTYAVYLPKQIVSDKNQFFISYKVQNNINSEQNAHKISIVVEKFIPQYISNTQNDNELSSDIMQEEDNDFDLINLEHEFASIDHNTNDCVSSSCNNTDQINDQSDVVLTNMNHTSIDKNNSFTFPDPPSPSELDVFTEEEPAASSSLSYQEFHYIDLDSNYIKVDDNSILSFNTLDKNNDCKLNISDSISDEHDLSYRLSIHKQTKFSSIGTQEYLDKLEKSITDRKKDICTSDMEKMLNKLHIAISESSIDDSCKTDDSFDSFH